MRPAAARPAAAIRGASLLKRRADPSILIEPTYCGPADRANGGYVAGLIARHIEAPFEVKYRRPVPLGRSVQIVRAAPGEWQVVEGNAVLAEVNEVPFEVPVPAPPSQPQAEHASHQYIGLRDHPFPRCFVCGTQRTEGDGLRIFAGPVEREARVAALWTPHAVFSADRLTVRPEIVWAALDCPGCFAAMLGRPAQPAVLGRFAAHVQGVPQVGEPCRVYGWPIAHDGRKHRVGTAIVNRDGVLLGSAVATWIDVPHGDAGR